MKAGFESVKAFDEYAERYDMWYSKPENRQVFESELMVIRSLGLSGFGDEVGVGAGVFASNLHIPLGVDPAHKMLRIARDRGIEVVRAVGEALPFIDECLDYVLYVVTLCFLKDPILSISEARRVLRDGGKLIICFIPRDSYLGELYSKRGMEGHRIYRFARFYSISEVKSMLKDVGFMIVAHAGTLKNIVSGDFLKRPYSSLDGCSFICLKAKKGE